MNRHRIVRVEGDTRRDSERSLVRESPLRLVVNGTDLATLIASPHQLRFLVAGFLRLQGFVGSLDDFLSFGICAEQGVAQIHLRGQVPQQLRPVLTSGCGSGIVFELPSPVMPEPSRPDRRFTQETVFALMRELSRRSEQYASHGGIHSAAVGDGAGLLLHAEDLGRHNTLDRLAGEALFQGLDLSGTLVVTSGRISTEMVAKAARLGIAVIASRTSPTDLAVAAATAAGITLIGYLRGNAFEIYSHPERIVPAESTRIPGVSAVILAGGESRRMGCDKSLLPVAGARFIDHIYRRLAALFEEVILVTNSPGLYEDLPCRKVPDIYPQQGTLAGIHSGLCHARNHKVFVAACDMPSLSVEVVRRLCQFKDLAEVVIPRGGAGLEPLHALYGKSCIAAIEEQLDGGARRIVSFFPQVEVHEVAAGIFADCDPEGRSFGNINTPDEYFALRESGVLAAGAVGQPPAPRRQSVSGKG